MVTKVIVVRNMKLSAMQKLKYKIFGACAIFGLFYLWCLPSHVQGGDTGELVAAAYLNFVPHPPGYPLWQWLQHLATNFIPVGTVFWRASFMNTIFAISTLGIFTHSFRRNWLVIALSLPILALSPVFFEAAILPDVFSLHAFFIVMIGAIFFHQSEQKIYFLPFVFLLTLAHHHTILLLLPVLCMHFWLERKSWKLLIKGAAGGAFFSFLAYTNLLLLKTGSEYSWSDLTSWSALWQHILRVDYGTFSLTSSANFINFDSLLYFLKASFSPCSLLLVLAVWKFRARDLRIFAWALSAALSVIFLLFLNIGVSGTGKEILFRFHLMPLVLFVFLFATFLSRIEFSKKVQKVSLLITAGISLLLLMQDSKYLSLRNDTFIENYAKEILSEIKDPTVIVAEGDAAYFSIRYVQSVLGVARGSVVVSPSLFFHPWYLEKVQKVFPQFVLPNAQKIWSERAIDLDQDFYRPNKGMKFFVSKNFNFPYVDTHYGKLGKIIRPGTGKISFENFDLSEIEKYSAVQGAAKKFLQSQYAYYYLAKASWQFREGNTPRAQENWNLALHLVPFAFPALENLCMADPKDSRCEKEFFEKVREESRGYF